MYEGGGLKVEYLCGMIFW